VCSLPACLLRKQCSNPAAKSSDDRPRHGCASGTRTGRRKMAVKQCCQLCLSNRFRTQRQLTVQSISWRNHFSHERAAPLIWTRDVLYIVIGCNKWHLGIHAELMECKTGTKQSTKHSDVKLQPITFKMSITATVVYSACPD